jgi:hypothetical protein
MQAKTDENIKLDLEMVSRISTAANGCGATIDASLVAKASSLTSVIGPSKTSSRSFDLKSAQA